MVHTNHTIRTIRTALTKLHHCKPNKPSKPNKPNKPDRQFSWVSQATQMMLGHRKASQCSCFLRCQPAWNRK